jgi:hypothetical protein
LGWTSFFLVRRPKHIQRKDYCQAGPTWQEIDSHLKTEAALDKLMKELESQDATKS